ncbi:MAG: carboxypeptidase-like regulatory domain-containing protein, partial [Acidobacteriota bacterium]|nr:carboxypeptidase-like regulatory domain-containing protein [Acidobacteriota bacterium]
MKRTLLIFALAAVVCLPAIAQQSATIRGSVNDPSGAPAADVQVTVLNVGMGFSRETATNSSGAYAAANLPVGTYLVTFEAAGFRTVLVQNVVLNVNDTREVNAQLEELTEVTGEAITVTSSAVVVETIGGEVAGLITGEEVRELPLNGRNFLQLTLLMPGVSAPEGFNTKNKGLLTGSDLSVSGGSTTANMWTVDGASNNDVGSNRTILVYPSVEAIEEFKIHRNSYGAEFGGGGGAQINLVTRGGTNNLDGSVYYFARRDSYNSTNALLKEANQPKAPLTRDDYGFTFGGPVKKDKFHFFASAEWNDEIRGVAVSGQVPTAAQRAGDFNDVDTSCGYQIPVDPLTGQPFPNNTIPGDRMSQSGINLLRLYPNANNPGSCTNWVTSVSTPIDWEQINGRLDYTVNDQHRVLLRYTADDWSNPGPTGGAANGLWGDDPFPSVDSNWAQPSDSLVAQLNSVIGNSAINSLTFSQSGNEIDIGASDQDATLREDLRNTL